MSYHKSGPSISVGDIEIGAVELKDATADTRAQVAATGSIVEGNVAVAVHDPILGVTTGAAVVTDAAGTIQQFLRGLVVHLVTLLARTPALGKALAAASMPVTLASNEAPLAGASRIVAIGAASAEMAAPDLAAGAYLVYATCDCWWDFTASGGGGSAAVATAPAEFLPAGVQVLRRLDAAGRAAAITSGATGYLVCVPVS